MSLSSAFGSSRGSNASPAFHFSTGGHPTLPTTPKHTSSFLGNLASDIHDAAVGLPMGLVMTAKHPIRSVEQSAKMTWQDWSPLFHGHTSEWYHSFHEHPLQPILDVASVATLPFSGAGAALKGAETASRVAGATDVADRIAPIAAKFRASSRSIHEIEGAPEGVIHYHGNPLIRTRQKAVEKMKNVLLRDSDMKRQARYLDRKIAEHHAGTNVEMLRQFRAAKAMFKDPSVTVSDITGLLRPHIRQMMSDHAFRVDAATARKLDKQNFEFLSATPLNKEHFPTDKTPQEFAKWIKTQGAANTTGSMQGAAREGQMYLVVRKDAVRDYLKEGANTYGALHALWTKPTQVWKWLVLATVPRYFVNNVVGNMLMYSMSANPLATTRGLYHAMADTVGRRAAMRGMTSAEKAMTKLDGDWQSKWYLGPTQGFSSEVTGVAEGKGTLARGVMDRTTKGIYGITHTVSDQLPRAMALHYIIKRQPEYQELYRAYKASGKGSLEAHRIAADEASSIPVVRDRVGQEMNNVLGQYTHFSPLEDKVRNFVPFYSWMRAITRHTAHIASERPLQAAYMANMGQRGADQTEKELGKIPDFMKGYIPVSSHHGGIIGKLLGETHAGRRLTLSTQGTNPYSTFGDVADIANAALSGHVPSGDTAAATSIHPMLQAMIEHVTGQSLLTGAKIQRHGGFIPDVAYRTFSNVPQVAMVKAGLEGPKKPKVDKRTGKTHGPLLFRNDFATMFRDYLGVPVKQESPVAAASQFDKEQGVKKGRTKKGSSIQLKFPKGRSSHRASKYRVRKTVRRQTSKGISGLGVSAFHVKNDLPKIKF